MEKAFDSDPARAVVASPFEVLGIEPGADDDEIERAYRRRVKETHPDHGGSARAFQRVRRAYEEILDADGDADPVTDLDGATAPPDGTGWSDGMQPETETEPEGEYLNYEVVVDHGWSLDDDDLFEKAADAGLDPEDYGRFRADAGETLLRAAEDNGFVWPYACRGGACANCAVAVVTGELSMAVDHILPQDLLDRGIQLSCVGSVPDGDLQVVYNVKHLPTLDDLRLPPGPFGGTTREG